MKIYIDKNVLEVAQERISEVFDICEYVYVSVSGGKDSTVLYHLVLNEAIRRDRKIHLFFLDQELEYDATIRLMRIQMDHPNVIPMWYQVPIYMTNATSYSDEFLYAWGEGEEWIRPKEDISIKSIDEDYPKRFYPFFDWFERNQPDNSAFFVGLRAEEGLNRFRAVTKHPGYNDIKWSSQTPNPKSYRFYPLYDWGHGDIWKYIDDNRVPYNEIYDKMFAANHGIYNTLRVSNLIHEKSFHCLTALQELEPETYNKVIKRLGGTHCAALYARETMIYSGDRLPKAFESWKAYRDYLLATSPTKHRERFEKRWENQPDDEYTCRQQCKQLMINDWENNIPVTTNRQKKIKKTLEKWRAIL